jgi:hypothetical protein
MDRAPTGYGTKIRSGEKCKKLRRLTRRAFDVTRDALLMHGNQPHGQGCTGGERSEDIRFVVGWVDAAGDFGCDWDSIGDRRRTLLGNGEVAESKQTRPRCRRARDGFRDSS